MSTNQKRIKSRDKLMAKIFLSVLFALCINIPAVFPQASNQADSAAYNMTTLSEASILYQQRIIDSIVKAKLQSELQVSSGDRKKTLELERKLKEIKEKDSLGKVALAAKINLLRKTAKGYPVVPFFDTLFLIFNKAASSSAAERATNITNRIKKIYDDPFFMPDSMKIEQNENGAEIVYLDGSLVMLVSKIDALMVYNDESQLAAEYREKIVKAIVEERDANSFKNWAIRIGKAFLIIAGLWLLVYLINKLFRLLNSRTILNRENRLLGMLLNKFKIFSPAQIEKFILRIMNLIRLFVILITVYLSLPLLFSIFPETKMWTATLLDWILSPANIAFKAVLSYLPNLFSILVIIVIFRYAIKAIKFFVDQIEKGEIKFSGFHPDWAQPTFKLLKFLLYAFMVVLIFPYLPGSDSLAFQGVSVFLGILFSLGSSSAIANIVAGMVITYMRPFKVGDRVKIGEITGDVMEKSMLVTRIRTINNEDITVPNSTVLSSSTTNYSTNTGNGNSGLIIYTTVTIGYDVPWKDVHQALIAAALRTDKVLKKPEPFVLQTSLDDFYVSYKINAYTKEANKQAAVYSHLHQNIQDCFNEAGIEIMSPHYRAQRDGNLSTIPATYLDKDYQAPAFNVKQVSDEGSKTK
jgi:small-conductance mechanosensitive channel